MKNRLNAEEREILEHFERGGLADLEGLRLLIFDGPYGPGFRRGGTPGTQARDVGAVDTRDGGNAIPYMDEDPQIRKTYEEELAPNGMQSRMPQWAYETCTPPEGALEPGGF